MGKYPILSVTAGAEEVLAGHKEVEEIRQEVIVPSRKTKKSALYISLRGCLGLASGGLFEHLRQHRKQLASQASGTAVYYISQIRVLIGLASIRP